MNKASLAPQILAHRGASAYAPENTQAAFQKALIMGAKGIETDISLLADGNLVLFHDETLQRCAGQDLNIREIDLALFRQYEIGSWFSPEFNDQFVWSLQDLHDWLNIHPSFINLELKVHQQEDEELAEQITRALKKWPATLLQNTLLSSFSIEALAMCQEQCPHIPRALLVETLNNDAFLMAERLQTKIINFGIDSLDKDVLEQGQQAGFRFYSYTCNDPATIRPYLGKTLNGVFTDKPDVLLAAYPHPN